MSVGVGVGGMGVSVGMGGMGVLVGVGGMGVSVGAGGTGVRVGARVRVGVGCGEIWARVIEIASEPNANATTVIPIK